MDSVLTFSRTGPAAELTRLGLSGHLAGEGKVRPMAWVARSLTNSRELATAQVLLHDAAASHIPQMLHLPEDLSPLPLVFPENQP